jgi:hypothetical protein
MLSEQYRSLVASFCSFCSLLFLPPY